jgi:DNA-binding MarR family transcriptional regulator
MVIRDESVSQNDGVKIELGRLSDSVAFSLRLAQNASFSAFSRLAEEDGLKPGHYGVLQIVAENDRITQTLLSAACGRDKSTLSPIISDLEKRAFLYRERSKIDRRVQFITLTSEGKALLTRLASHAKAHDASIAALMSAEEKSLLIMLLNRITNRLSMRDENATGEFS